MPFISICIPTYNSGEKLERLLKSIEQQTFTDFEIVISDDSNNAEIPQLIDTSYKHLNISYYHNETPLGTPNNWNNAVEKSSGEWIKLMHHDDWFTQNNALSIFVNAINESDNAKLLFCSFSYVNVETGTTKLSSCSKLDIFLLKQNYLNLFKNFIGNPSVTLINKLYKPYKYDKNIKWLIDFDFYINYFKIEKKFIYIDQPLIAFGVHHTQVTTLVQNNPTVEIPESYLLFNKHGIRILKNMFVYDFFWRMYRNLNLKSITEFEKYLGQKNDYKEIQNIICHQNLLGKRLLNIGVVSKLVMFFSYLYNKFFR